MVSKVLQRSKKTILKNFKLYEFRFFIITIQFRFFIITIKFLLLNFGFLSILLNFCFFSIIVLGLGTSTAQEAREYFSNLSRHRLRFLWQSNAPDNAEDRLIRLAFARDRIDERKQWLAVQTSR